MSIGSLTSLAGSYVQSLLGSTLTSKSGVATRSGAVGSASPAQDVNRLSPFAELLTTLQQLQQSNPARYSQVTHQIAANLTNAAQTAQSNGDSPAAGLLNQWAGEFNSASQNNQLPDLQHLALATRHHLHHRHSGANPADSSGGATGDTTSDLVSQLTLSYQGSAGTSQSTDPMAIVGSTLAGAGIR